MWLFACSTAGETPEAAEIKLNICDALPRKVHKVFFRHFEVMAEMKTREKDL